MQNVWTIARQELKQLFASPIAYTVAFMILFILGLIFAVNLVVAIYQQYAPSIEIITGPLITLLLFTIPAITMRTISEEQSTGTLELLLTAPIQNRELITGKWLGNFLFYTIIILMTLVYPLILNQVISPGLDNGLVISNFLGLVLLAGAMTAIGVGVSACINNQIGAFFITITVFMFLWMLSYPVQASGTVHAFLNYLDLSENFYPTFYQGIIKLNNIVYLLSLTVVSLFIGSASIQAKRLG